MVDRVGGDQDGTDVFEAELGGALRRVGEEFAVGDGATLVDAGVRSGRRRLRRRRAGAMGGSVAALAVVGLGASYVGGAFDSPHADVTGVAARPSASTVQGKGPHGTGPVVSKADMIKILQGLLPEGKFSEQDGMGTERGAGANAHLVFDDRHGKAAIGVSVGAVDPQGTEGKQLLQCPDKNAMSFDECRVEKLAGGARIQLMRGYEYPDRRADTKMWSAVLLTREGFTVSVSEWNAPAEKGAAISRPEPPLSLKQLKAMATSDKWRPAMKSIGAAPDEPLAAPPALGQDRETILKRLTSQLPKGLKVKSRGGQESEYAYMVVDDGKGPSLVQINVQTDMKDVENDLFGADAETLPDGTKVTTRTSHGDDKGGAGIVMWTADMMRPDGFRVVVSAFNSEAQTKDANRAEPALTLAELKKIVLSDVWTDGSK
ncbi:hypothetical protein [Streptomyces sp. VRA16 Mangrove soil]|uniref:hypothetical protein n=1 Tax=Streptomyces sp. VRA16 Mangrove soil TaxID=2817434 RepID=UPI001A9E1BAA|nr:hypothetical protein [Streptomyces sp. VRA16 Mangrove soil]MBO1333817.1 hypothetical protein [Streptomyces sp. VRA16 Mangrove soil]